MWVEFAKNPDLLDELEIEVGVRKLLEERSDSLKPGDRAADIHALPKWTWHAVAASVLVLVAFLQVFNDPPKTELSEFLVDHIPADQIETSDGIRAKEMIITPADSLLNLGFNASLTGNTDQAIELFDDVIENFDTEPYGSKAYLNKGIIYYNKGDYDQSIEAFNAAIERVEDSNLMIAEKAWWYLANALVNVGQSREALTATHKTYAYNGIFRDAAFLLYQKLNYDLGYSDYDNFEEQTNQ